MFGESQTKKWSISHRAMNVDRVTLKISSQLSLNKMINTDSLD